METATRHARGENETAKARRIEGSPHRAIALGWIDGKLKGGVTTHGEKTDSTDYIASFKRWKADTGIGERANLPVAQHLLAIVSEGAIEGDPRDPSNPRVIKLVMDAIKWAEEEFGGPKSVWAARYDVDEKAVGVVDILISPHHEFRSGRGKKKDRIALSAAHKRLREKWNQYHSYSAMQDSWHDFASKAGWDVQRGIPKEQTAREHLSPEAYKRTLPELAQKSIESKDAQIESQKAEVADLKAELESTRLQLNAERARNRR